jgi:hypothetical protein
MELTLTRSFEITVLRRVGTCSNKTSAMSIGTILSGQELSSVASPPSRFVV